LRPARKEKRMIKKIALLILISVLTTLPILSASENQGETLIKSAESAYKACSSYSDETSIRFSVKMGAKSDNQQTEYLWSFAKPAKLAVAVQKNGNGLSLFSDGETLTSYIAKENRYTAEKAPADLGMLIAASPVGQNLTIGDGIFAVKFLHKDFWNQLTKTFTKIEYVGEEVLDSISTDHIRLHHSSGRMAMDVFLDQSSHLVVRCSGDIGPLMQMSASAQQPQGSQPPSFLIEESHRNISVNKPVKDEIFKFTPPADAKKVETLFESEQPAAPKPGNKAADFTIQSLEQNKTLKLEDYKGKVIMLDFWATWCGPCRMEMPALQKVHISNKDKDFVFIAVNVREPMQKVADFIAKQKFTFAVGMDADGQMAMKYGVSAFPTLFLIDKKGTVQAVHMGYDPNIEKTLQQEIDSLLSGKDLEGAKKP
jgi:thiol-disulfide isomerase/thioredoxin